jgi:DNA mismatch endonuclease (patch repair protein)
MADVHSKEQRRRNMSAIQSKNTKPELLIRSELHKKGFRFRIHRKDLPGKPDILLPKYQAVINVHGCFWHGHSCPQFKWPKTRKAFWRKKILGNMARDTHQIAALFAKGYRVAVIWECSIEGPSKIEQSKLMEQIASWILSESNELQISGADISSWKS